jgi:glutamyl-Q tRNA(Asp) synthetase
MALYAPSSPPARDPDVPYIGRFAPSPSGPLHFGSLIAALASWLDARAAQGRWLVRIEDLDAPRARAEATDQILRTLDALGLHWDGEVQYQSRRLDQYRAALARLDARGLTYPCACSRREIADSSLGADGARIYPGTCRNGLPAGRQARAVRVRATPGEIRFADRLQGELRQDVAEAVGDFILARADGVFAYQLAVVVDDAEQGVTDIVRGADLLDSTARQIFLQRLLGYPQPRYLHVPVAVNAAGEKLSKQTGARAVDSSAGSATLAAALTFLGQPAGPNASVRELLQEAVRRWDPARVPARRTLNV